MENSEIIKKALLFSGLSDEHLADVAQIAVRRPFAKGETLFTEGEQAEGFYLLARGALKLCKISPDGREKVLHMVHPVETFAEAAFFGDGRYPAEARGVEKGEVLYFPRESFMGLLERNPRFSMNLIASLSMLLRRFAHQIEELSFADAPSRLASYLLELGNRKGTTFQGKTYVELDMRKGELASRLGTVSETLSRTLKKLKDEGIIEVDGSKVVILNVERLRQVAGK
ncbi:Crp/Fnr family transcriptional regulator [Geomesophilobacter sediminis]|uniref:Crp/Fnr family transcriptional regulator n=1 Tax=Geomesophilobacter sediminis TaxID=2798584 RepID=A0A8J7M1T6_9BACT|nr:Crp/Fnr family transcriptional regulator [Geomesophilobacter sediminis]MBJ6727067.1 Crp/Fnr family transcriptional regulator [Geomesophilobacter sediminis]